MEIALALALGQFLDLALADRDDQRLFGQLLQGAVIHAADDAAVEAVDGTVLDQDGFHMGRL
jgi:hypothetical protein